MDNLDQLFGITAPCANCVCTDCQGTGVSSSQSHELIPMVVEATTIEEMVPANTVVVTQDIKDLDADFEVARQHIKEAITKVAPLLDSAILLAQSGDEPRAYEVVGGLLDAISNAGRKLTDIHNTRRNVKEPRTPAPTSDPQASPHINIEKAVFIGRASDLLRDIKKLQKEQEKEKERMAQSQDQNALSTISFEKKD